MTEYIDREAALEAVTVWHKKACQPENMSSYNMGERAAYTTAISEIIELPAADVRPVPKGGIGEMSDGYHTFNGLYYQRMVLFAALVKAHEDKAWKSWKHEDGELCFGGGWFIVGIDTPEGSYTYHYDNTVWDFFDCEELPTAKHWDGHTEKDVNRLLSLNVRPVVRGHWIGEKEAEDMGDIMKESTCSVCGCCEWDCTESESFNFCPNCGADMRDADNEKA